jgi:hypothetical protein
LTSSRREEAFASSLFFAFFPSLSLLSLFPLSSSLPQYAKYLPQAEMLSRKELQRKEEGIFHSTNSTRTEVAVRQFEIVYIRKKYSDNNTLI